MELLKLATTFAKTKAKREFRTMAASNEIEILREVEIVPDEDSKGHVKR